MCVINIYRVYFRINSNPALIFIWSIPVQIVTALIIMMFYYLDREINLNYFFLPTLIFILFHVFRLFINKEFTLNFAKVMDLLKKSIKYYWAVIVSSSISIIIGNYAKVDSFINLTEIERFWCNSFKKTFFKLSIFNLSFFLNSYFNSSNL